MSLEDFPLPKKGEKLIKENGNYHEFSHIGWGDTGTQFFGYMKGYKESADSLIDYCINSRDISILDTYFYPICFLYRQYLELAIKSIYLQYSEEDWNEKEKTVKKVNHNLVQIWKKIKTLLMEISNETDDMIDIVEDYIKQFQDFDSSSSTFRYPINKDLVRVISKERRINLVNLKSRITELYNFFSSCEDMLRQILDYRYEFVDF